HAHKFWKVHRASDKYSEPFDNAVAPALRFKRGNDADFYHRANLPIGSVAIDFGDTFILGGREGFAMTKGVGQKPSLANVDLSRRELVEPAGGICVVDRGVA